MRDLQAEMLAESQCGREIARNKILSFSSAEEVCQSVFLETREQFLVFITVEAFATRLRQRY